MNFIKTIFSTLVLLLMLVHGFAQITITHPLERMIFQRNNANNAAINIAGNYDIKLDSVQAMAEVRTAGQGTTTSWATIQVIPSNGYFKGTLTVSGGWYKLYVKGYSNGVIVDTDTLQRVGVGEVFAIAGQSNAQGGASNGFGATDDRVNSVDYSNDFSSYNKLPIGFSMLTDTSQLAPFNYVPWCWGKLGDLLVQKLNVPVLFYGAAHGGTSSTQWSGAAQGIPFDGPSWVRQDLGAPYRALENSIAYYGSLTGLRAVLWHQGESDHDQLSTTYYNNILNVINISRQNAEFNQLAWVIARASINPDYHQNVIDGQNMLINNVSNVFAGAYTDNYTGSTYRSDGIHLDTPAGITAHANEWNTYLNTTFFTNSTPMQAATLLDVTLACNTANPTQPITLSVPAVYHKIAWSNRQNTAAESIGLSHDGCCEYTFYPPPSYEAFNWQLDSTFSITKPAARFAVNVRNVSRKVKFSPVIDLRVFTLPLQPSFTLSASQIRPNDSVTLTAQNCNGTYVWSTGATQNPYIFTPSNTASYTIQCRTLHCLSEASATQNVMVSSCFATPLALVGAINSAESPYFSQQTISSTQQVLSTGTILYKAAQSIELTPGFQTNKGGVFQAQIGGCN